MNMGPLRFYLNYAPNLMMYQMWIMNQDKRVTLALIEHAKDEFISPIPPSIEVPHINSEVLQDLCEQLWRLGFRPKDANFTDGERSALRDHLADLRAIAIQQKGRIK
jgi:hypothetical protein